MSDITYHLKLTTKQLELLSGLSIDKYILPPFSERQEERINATEIHRRLYGIISFFREMNPQTGHKYYNFFIPERNKEAVEEAQQTGWFSKYFPEEDIHVLNLLYQRTQELYNLYGYGWSPEFTVTEVMKKTGLKKLEARESLDKLIGTIGFFSEGHMKFPEKGGTVTIATPYWFIPKHRTALIEELLNRTKGNHKNFYIDR